VLAGGKRARLSQAPAAPVPALPPSKRICTKIASAGAAVGSTRELVERVLGFLAGGSRGARGDVGRAASVCRLWRDVAYGEEVWGRMAAEVLPMLEGVGADGRRYVAEQGRCLVERRVWHSDQWWEGLRLHMEAWDARDNLRMLSAEGRLKVDADENGKHVNLTITGGDRREVVGPAFSAVSRAPGHHRIAHMYDCFLRARVLELPCAVCLRAVVSDARTGRQALLWESGKETELWAGPVHLNHFDPGPLPDGSICFGTNGDEGILSPAWGGTVVGVDVGFYLRPEEGQAGVEPRDRLYRAAGGDVERYADHDSFCYMAFEVGDEEALGKYIRSLLAD
jgi:hypothetical protein